MKTLKKEIEICKDMKNINESFRKVRNIQEKVIDAFITIQQYNSENVDEMLVDIQNQMNLIKNKIK